MNHAILSASSAARWLACPPSARLEQLFSATTNKYAEEGTAAHALAERTAAYWMGIITEAEYENWKKDFESNEYYTLEMQDCANAYARLVYESAKDAQDVVFEERVDFSQYVPEGFGTSDCIIIGNDWINIIDYKYGTGYRVEAANNPQLRLYALGAYQLYPASTVRMTIFQPRISREPSTEVITAASLLAWAEHYVRPRAEQAWAGKGEYSPSAETCKFCRAKAQCRARAEHNLKVFDDAPDLQLLSIDEAGAILEQAEDMRAWLADLEEVVYNALLDGESVPGWKLADGRRVRQFADQQKLIDFLAAKGYNPDDMLWEKSFTTPAKLEKKVGKLPTELINYIAGKPVLEREKKQ